MPFKITFIGHSTALIEADGRAVLTDPNFNSKVIFVKRQGVLGYDPAGLPELAAVLISHTHIDHLDLPSFAYIKTSVPVIVPEGSGRYVSRFIANPVIELAHWAGHELKGGLKIHAMPAVHPGSHICPHHYKNAASYIIEIGERKIFFSSDTSYSPHFRDIGNTYTIDCALLPIGSYRPAFFMKRYHMDPKDAVQAFTDLKAGLMIPIHWGAFRLSFEKLNEPAEWLEKIAKERGLTERIKILRSGEAIEL